MPLFFARSPQLVPHGEELLESLPPFLGGGEMILDVRKDGFTPNDIPWRFEAGTPPITEAIESPAYFGRLLDGASCRGLKARLLAAFLVDLIIKTSVVFARRDIGDRHVFGVESKDR